MKRSKGADMSSAMTEEERLKAMYNMEEDSWLQTKQEMANDTRVQIAGGRNSQKKVTVPEGEPPRGYVCYRCGKKGHFIQACPTNDDPDYEGQKRRNRTTGIPRSMLKSLDKEVYEQMDEAAKQNVMIDQNGDLVLQQADEREWKKHQERVQAAAEAQALANAGDKEAREAGLECSIDKRLFVEPMKTPCCGMTFCKECIENAIFESAELTCPNCKTDNVIVENLVPDHEAADKIRKYLADKTAKKEGSKSPISTLKAGSDPSSRANTRSPSPSNDDGAPKSRKRSIDEATGSSLKPEDAAAPAMKRQKSGESKLVNSPNSLDAKPSEKTTSPAPQQSEEQQKTQAEFMKMMQQMQGMPNMNNNMPQMPSNWMQMMQGMPNMPNMNFPMQNMMPGGMPFMGMPNMNMNMNMMPNLMPPNFNTNIMPNSMPYNNQQQNGNSKRQPQAFNSNTNNTPAPHNQHPMNGIPGIPTGPKAQAQNGNFNATKFANQQRHTGNEEDNAYMRQPVNPHRHQNRAKRARQADYRELGA